MRKTRGAKVVEALLWVYIGVGGVVTYGTTRARTIA